jgi:hypothetical protein
VTGPAAKLLRLLTFKKSKKQLTRDGNKHNKSERTRKIDRAIFSTKVGKNTKYSAKHLL